MQSYEVRQSPGVNHPVIPCIQNLDQSYEEVPSPREVTWHKGEVGCIVFLMAFLPRVPGSVRPAKLIYD